MKKRNIWFFLLVGLTAFLLWKQCKTEATNLTEHDNIKMIEALQDSVRFLLDKKGNTITTIKTIEVPKKVFVKIKSGNDSLLQIIKELNDEIIQLESAVVLMSETRFHKDSIPIKTEIVYRDTSSKEVLEEIVSADYHDEWVDVDVKMNIPEESLSLDFSMVNTLEVWHERKKGKLFKPGHLEVFVRNENPYVRTPKLRSYKVQEKQKRIGLGIIAGAGWNKSLIPEPFIGTGVYYRIW